jgi:hypothetical protein
MDRMSGIMCGRCHRQSQPPARHSGGLQHLGGQGRRRPDPPLAARVDAGRPAIRPVSPGRRAQAPATTPDTSAFVDGGGFR